MVDCDYAESYGWFISGGNADASHAVYIVPDNSYYSSLGLSFGIRTKSLSAIGLNTMLLPLHVYIK